MSARTMMASGWLMAACCCLAAEARAADAAAEDSAGEPAPTALDADKGSHKHSGTAEGERWENGLDAKLTSLFTRELSDITSPTLMLTAQWNYRMQSGTYVGFSASGTPQPSQDTDSSGTQRNFTLYYGGINLAQEVFETGPYRVVGGVTLSKGVVYVRGPTLADGTSDIGNSTFYVIEPEIFGTFFEYAGLDIGAVLSYRIVSLDKTDRASNADLSSVSLGVTFRTRSY